MRGRSEARAAVLDEKVIRECPAEEYHSHYYRREPGSVRRVTSKPDGYYLVGITIRDRKP